MKNNDFSIKKILEKEKAVIVFFDDFSIVNRLNNFIKATQKEIPNLIFCKPISLNTKEFIDFVLSNKDNVIETLSSFDLEDNVQNIILKDETLFLEKRNDTLDLSVTLPFDSLSSGAKEVLLFSYYYVTYGLDKNATLVIEFKNIHPLLIKGLFIMATQANANSLVIMNNLAGINLITASYGKNKLLKIHTT